MRRGAHGFSIILILKGIICFEVKESMQNRKVNFNKKEKELKLENPTRTFSKTNLVLQAQTRISNQKSNCYEWRLEKEKSVKFISVYTVVNKVPEYIWFHIS